MSKTRGARRLWRAIAVGVVGLALTGCAGLRPGVAVQVGDETIPLSKVDEIAQDFCAAVEPQLQGQAETVAHGYFRSGIAGTLAMRSIAEQLAEEHGIDPTRDEEYAAALAESRQGVAVLPEELRDSVFEVDSAPQYVEAVQAALGRSQLDGQGDRAAFVAAGQEEFDRWVAEHGVEFNPEFNTVMKDGTIANQDMAVSYAVSEQARNGLETEPNSVVARQLPTSHRCGR